MERYDLLIVGGGAAGMAAALSACRQGQHVLLAEHEPVLGGILNQCIHRGFGHAVFREDLTGPEYAARFITEVTQSGIHLCLETTVLSISPDQTALLSGRSGLKRVGFERCILAAGCREKTIQSLAIAGTRPAGIFTAGTVQQLMNRGGYQVGQDVVILGSGDIGQIVARQLVQSGRRVTAMIEQNDQPGGLERNRRECLTAYAIPLMLRSTVDEILGHGRITGVTVRNLDTGSRSHLSCDTLITAIGLIPDRTLCRDLMIQGHLPSWLRLCGNCDYVHEIVDSVTREGELLGQTFT